jgi:hypothetical protein
LYAAGIGSDQSCQPPELPVAAFHEPLVPVDVQSLPLLTTVW